MIYTNIILSGLPFSGKSSLAKKLAEVFKWPIYSIGQLWREEWKKKYPNADVGFEEYWRNTTIEENREMDQKAKEVFKNGMVIGDVRYLTNYMDLPSLLVFVTADLNKRALRAFDNGVYQGKLDDIKEIMLRREMDELRVGKELYGEEYDYRDPKHCHLTINSGLLDIYKESCIISRMIHSA